MLETGPGVPLRGSRNNCNLYIDVLFQLRGDGIFAQNN